MMALVAGSAVSPGDYENVGELGSEIIGGKVPEGAGWISHPDGNLRQLELSWNVMAPNVAISHQSSRTPTVTHPPNSHFYGRE